MNKAKRCRNEMELEMRLNKKTRIDWIIRTERRFRSIPHGRTQRRLRRLAQPLQFRIATGELPSFTEFYLVVPSFT